MVYSNHSDYIGVDLVVKREVIHDERFEVNSHRNKVSNRATVKFLIVVLV